MGEPKRVSKEEIQSLLDTISRADIMEMDEKELDEAIAAARALLEPGWDWFICKPCPFCGQTAVIALPKEGVEKYTSGTHPQYAFPGLSAETRELVHTGIHPECWNTLLPTEED
jgi:hypothetical protein